MIVEAFFQATPARPFHLEATEACFGLSSARSNRPT
jgi:hypothetical protein